MSIVVLQLLAWAAVGIHLAIGLVARRRMNAMPAVPMLNFFVALLVAFYRVPRWIAYATQGVRWNWTDGLIPLYALAVCLVSGVGLAGRCGAMWPHWVVFGAHTLVLIGAALFVGLITFANGI